MPPCGCGEDLLSLRKQEKRQSFLGWISESTGRPRRQADQWCAHIPNLARIDVFGSYAEERRVMPWWLGGIAASARRQLQEARGLERKQERRLNDAYARGYKKYRQRQKQNKRRER